VQQVPLPYAVFDLHFHPRNRSQFAIASSTGCIALFNVNPDSGNDTSSQPNIEKIWTKQVHDDPSVPALFLAWTPENWFSNPAADGFAVTFSDSRTSVFGTVKDITEEDGLDEWGSFEAKQMIEVWFVALAAMTPSSGGNEGKENKLPFMYTGNDFGSLHTRRFVSHAEKEVDETEPLAPLLLEHDDRARHHTAGVTAIMPLPVPLVEDAPILLTGSYDESLRVYHATRRGEVLAEEGLGGGVWRLQLLNTTIVPGVNGSQEQQFLVLASCMHAGTRVVRVTLKQEDQSSEWSIQVLAEFTEHESMNYASDVWRGSEVPSESQASSEVLCVSSSFYDRRVCVWRAMV
jgi:diphthamide biosynthesis protein 7